MQLEDYFDFVSPDEIRIQGHRVWMEHVLDEHLHGAMTVEQLVERFPTLSREKILAVLLYYERNKNAMDAYLARYFERSRNAEEAGRVWWAAHYKKFPRLQDRLAAMRRSDVQAELAQH